MLTSQQKECDKHLKNDARWGLVPQTASDKMWGFLLELRTVVPGQVLGGWKEPGDSPSPASLKISARNILFQSKCVQEGPFHSCLWCVEKEWFGNRDLGLSIHLI